MSWAPTQGGVGGFGYSQRGPTQIGGTGSQPVTQEIAGSGGFVFSQSATITTADSFGATQLETLPGLLDGEVRLTFTAPTPPGAETIDGYQVALQVPHITPDNVASVATVTEADVAAPGATETLTISGLDEGNVYQFAVRPRWSGGSYGSWFMGGFGVAGRVTGNLYPDVPGDAVALSQADFDSGPWTPTAPGGRSYYLTEDITTTGAAVYQSGSWGYLYLNGYTITFGTAGASGTGLVHLVGVDISGLYGPGSLVQAGTSTYDRRSTTITVFDNSTTYGLTRYGSVVDVVGQGSAQNTIDALVTELNASTDANFTPYTYSRSGSGDTSRLVITSDSANNPFIMRECQTGGTGYWEGVGVDGTTTPGYGGSRPSRFYGWDSDVYGNWVDATSTAECRGVTIKVYGTNSHCIRNDGYYAGMQYAGNTLYNYAFDGARHFGWHGITIERAAASITAVTQIHHNTIYSRHQGIKVVDSGDATYGIWIHHNIVSIDSTSGGGTNDYALMNHGAYQEWFDNYAYGPKRGIHSDGWDAYAGSSSIYHNVLDMENESNEEYGPYEVHGIKHEFSANVDYHHNFVTVDTSSGDGDSQDAHALNVSGYNSIGGGGPSTGTEFHHNRFVAVAASLGKSAIAYFSEFTFGEMSTAVVNLNVFSASSQMIQVGGYFNYARTDGDLLADNAWIHEGSTSITSVVNYYTGPGEAEGQLVRDPITALDFTDVNVQQTGSSALYTKVQYTLTVYVHDGSAAVEGATVTVVDASANAQFSGTTDANGILRGTVTRYKMDEPAGSGAADITDYGQMDVTVSAGGFSTYNGDHTVAGTKAISVNLTAGTAAADASAPSAPSSLVGYARTPTAAYLTWTAPTDTFGIKLYKVYIGSILWALTTDTYFDMFGLTPATTYTTIKVSALDYGGNESSLATFGSITTPANNRGA